jgi:hypothetical protein
MFDFSFIKELLVGAGFESCWEVSPWESRIFENSELAEIQGGISEGHQSLFVEASKIER